MKSFNFKKFVLIVSFFCLVIGFALNYFREPTREEKVLRALNNDLRFTEKVTTNKTRIPSNDQSLSDANSHEATKSEVFNFLKGLKTNTRQYQGFIELEHMFVIKNPELSIQNLSLLNFNEYYFYSDETNLFDKSKYKTYKILIDQTQQKFGFLTGSIEIKLKNYDDRENVIREYNLEVLNEFISINTFYAQPANEEELIQINSRMKNDDRIDHSKPEIIQRFPKKL